MLPLLSTLIVTTEVATTNCVSVQRFCEVVVTKEVSEALVLLVIAFFEDLIVVVTMFRPVKLEKI